ncbi:MAG: type II secretion system protein GspH [Betaproteobacteria bacterium]|nr:type II secretion system protein GspH [Betaproteobacteria bacterium]
MRARQSGVSLIELMIGIILVGLLTALAAPSFRNWIQSSQVRTATDAITNGLQLSRAEAVHRNQPVRFTLPTADRAGWVVEAFDRDTGAWTRVQVRDQSEGTPNARVDASQTTVTFLGNGFVSPLPAQPITFNVTNPTGGACVTSSGDGEIRCLRVTVSAAGQIRMCDPALPSSNPAAC